MIRAIGAVAILAVLLAGQAAAQPQRPATQTIAARDLRFTLAPGAQGGATVTVRQGGRELLRVERTSAAFDADQDRRWVFLADANLDGYPDLWVLEAAGMVNTSYSLELFDPRTRSFAAVPGFERLSNPQVERRSQRIATSERSGCCAHTQATYRWRDSRLEVVAEWGDEAVPGENGAVCFVRLWRRERRDGAMVDRPDRYVALHVFNREPQAPACRGARPPQGGAR
jgi:hypothetical protein